MHELLAWILASAATGYLIGGIPFGIITGWLFGVQDIRQHGSQNPGALNAFRVAGSLPGLLTLLLDTGKGWITVYTVAQLSDFYIPLLTAAFFCIIGHMYPLYVGFRGGKSIAVFIGIIIYLAPWILLPLVISWVFFKLLVKQTALSSALSFGLTPLWAYLLGYHGEIIAFGFLAGISIALKHARDIKRNR